jgi:uncharacterized membrane protein YjjP (DUF1212 family)
MPLPSIDPASSPSSIPEVAFVLELGRTLQAFGVSAPTLEAALDRVTAHLGLEGAIYTTPTGFLASLRQKGHHGKTYLQRVESGGANLEKLAEAETLVDLVLADQLDLNQAREHLVRLVARPVRYGIGVEVGAYGLAAMGMADIFGGGWREVLLGALLGMMVGLTVHFSERRRNLTRLAPLLGGLLSSFGGALLGWLLPSVSYPILVVCGIIVLLPGMGLLVSMQELGTGHLVAGTARLAGTSLTFLLLAFGVRLGQRLGGAWLNGPAVDPVPLPGWTLPLGLAVFALGFLVVFHGRRRDYGWTLGATALAWAFARLGSHALGPEAGAGLAALALGSVCNQYSRRTRRPGASVLLPSLMVIVPGSLEFRGLSLMLHGETLAGLQAAFQAICVSVALMLGLLLANALVSRRTF